MDNPQGVITMNFNSLYPSANHGPATLESIEKISIPNGYVRTGCEMATMTDALAVGLLAGDEDGLLICDRKDEYGLYMLHFRDESSRMANLDSRARISQVRGWVVSCSGQLICRSFTEGDIFFTNPSVMKIITWNDYTFTPFLEGTTVRVFWSVDRWIYSTHRRIDCRTSRIPGVEVEIMELFRESWPEFEESFLHRDCIYIFQIVHRDNQTMNPEPVERPAVYHLATIGAWNSGAPFAIYAGQEQLPGAFYLNELTVDEVCARFAEGKSSIARKGYEITQLVPEQMRKLVEIRGIQQAASYTPIPLMYMRLPPADRPLLVHAVPYHLKDEASEESMEIYIETNIMRLSFFCAYLLRNKLQGNQINLSKTLTWLTKSTYLKNPQNLTDDEIAGAYENQIRAMAVDNGVTLYRCFRDMDSMERKYAETSAKYADIEVSVDVEPSPPPKKAAEPIKKKQQKGKKNGNGKGKKKSGQREPPREAKRATGQSHATASELLSMLQKN